MRGKDFMKMYRFSDLDDSANRVSLVLPMTAKNDSNTVVRRLSTPFHGLPSVVDYDPDTGYITFGELIEPPPKVEHPRRYKEPQMPVLNPKPGSCRHEYCWTTRRRLYGLPVDGKPIGFPWATGLLRHLPGHVKYKYPIPKSYNNPPRKSRRRPSMSPFEQDRKKNLRGVTGEMVDFYKVLMLAGYVISEAKAELWVLDEEGPDSANRAKDAQEPSKTDLPEKVPSGKVTEEGVKREAGGDLPPAETVPEPPGGDTVNEALDGEKTVIEALDGEKTVTEALDGEKTVIEALDGEKTVNEALGGEETLKDPGAEATEVAEGGDNVVEAEGIEETTNNPT